MFYTRPCSTPTSLPNKDYIGTKGERAYRGVMLWGSGAAYQWDTLSPCAPWGTGDAGRPRMGFPRSRSCQHPPLVHSLPPPNAHRGTRGHPEQHRCKSRARLWGWHKGGCSAGYCGCTLSKQHLQGAPSIYPKRAVGLLLGRCAAGPCSPACCMPNPSSGMAPTPPSNRNTTLPQAVLSSPALGDSSGCPQCPKASAAPHAQSWGSSALQAGICPVCYIRVKGTVRPPLSVVPLGHRVNLTPLI